MNEYTIQNRKTGHLDVMFGYSVTDAATKWNVNLNEWAILYVESIDTNEEEDF